jgi:drug/metabolite transporter (DMT)-like permease
MRLFLLTALTMVAFAANSVLNRAALSGGGIDALNFGTVRLGAGALILLALAIVLRRSLQLGGAGRSAGVLGLLMYIYGFSVAYQALDAGLGALILFGMVQITMFAGGLWLGERPPLQRWLGAAVAFSGLVWLLWPGGTLTLSLPHAAAMVLAGVGWGIYSLAGKLAKDPLVSTGANFLLALPLGWVLAQMLPVAPVEMTVTGMTLAVISGAVTSGLGYALWYRVLPELPGSVAAVAQLTVPVIALAGGMLFLGEPVSQEFVYAAVLVLGGVGLSLLPRKVT